MPESAAEYTWLDPMLLIKKKETLDAEAKNH
jgi:hypothetical protein